MVSSSYFLWLLSVNNLSLRTKNNSNVEKSKWFRNPFHQSQLPMLLETNVLFFEDSLVKETYRIIPAKLYNLFYILH